MRAEAFKKTKTIMIERPTSNNNTPKPHQDKLKLFPGGNHATSWTNKLTQKQAKKQVKESTTEEPI